MKKFTILFAPIVMYTLLSMGNNTVVQAASTCQSATCQRSQPRATRKTVTYSNNRSRCCSNNDSSRSYKCSPSKCTSTKCSSYRYPSYYRTYYPPFYGGFGYGGYGGFGYGCGYGGFGCGYGGYGYGHGYGRGYGYGRFGFYGGFGGCF